MLNIGICYVETVLTVICCEFVEWDAEGGSQSGHDKLVIEFVVVEYFVVVWDVVCCVDVCFDVGQVGSACTYAVVGVCACAESEIWCSLPVTAVVARMLSGKGEVGDFVLLKACFLGCV